MYECSDHRYLVDEWAMGDIFFNDTNILISVIIPKQFKSLQSLHYEMNFINRKKLKSSAKKQRSSKSNILLEDLFGHLSMDSDLSDSKYADQNLTDRTSAALTVGKHSNVLSSIEANNGSRTDSFATNP